MENKAEKGRDRRYAAMTRYMIRRVRKNAQKIF
jgi:hypothetical protein